MANDGTKKLVSLSESTRRNSGHETQCPECKGRKQGCKFCHDQGVVTKAKAARHGN